MRGFETSACLEDSDSRRFATMTVSSPMLARRMPVQEEVSRCPQIKEAQGPADPPPFSASLGSGPTGSELR